VIDALIVPDASVLLKWSLDSAAGKDQEKALAIRQGWLAGRHRIILTSIWAYEVGNILGRKGDIPLFQLAVANWMSNLEKRNVPFSPGQARGLRARINALMNLPSTCGAIASKSMLLSRMKDMASSSP
jgi:hypothetical protein